MFQLAEGLNHTHRGVLPLSCSHEHVRWHDMSLAGPKLAPSERPAPRLYLYKRQRWT